MSDLTTEELEAKLSEHGFRLVNVPGDGGLWRCVHDAPGVATGASQFARSAEQLVERVEAWTADRAARGIVPQPVKVKGRR